MSQNDDSKEPQLRVLRIVSGTSVDGPGLRTSIYLAGCSHHCPGCHNPQSWDFAAGEPMTVSELIARIADDDEDVTLTGGDPLQHPQGVMELARAIKQKLGKNVWCYTGYRWEEIVADERLEAIMRYIDVVVDAPFVLAERNIKLRFRGSNNQRLIDVPRSLESGSVVEWTDHLTAPA